MFKETFINKSEFINGFERVAKIVVQNETCGVYKNITQNVNPILAKCNQLYIDNKYDECAAELYDEVKHSKKIYYKIPYNSNCIYFGKTKNNQRELAFFRNLMKFAPNFSIYELGASEIKASKAGHNEILNNPIHTIVEVLKAYCFTESLMSQLRIYISALYTFSETLKRAGSNLNSVIVANDHSPTPVALSKISKHYDLQRIYLQHGSVSKYFPPLDFEFAFLYDLKTKKTYSDIKKTHCKVVVAPRIKVNENEWSQKFNEILSSETNSVVIYTTQPYNENYLDKIIMLLETNKSVRDIKIKFHPDAIRRHRSDIAIERIPKCKHVAIIGNSSVGMELLLQGNVVFYDSKLDSYPSDYYNFLEAGLVKQLEFEDYSKLQFWICDRKCHLNFTHFNDCIGTESSNINKILKEIYIKSTFSDYYFADKSKRILDSIIAHPNAFFSSAKKTNPYKLSDYEVLKVYDELFFNRLLPLSKCYTYIDKNNCQSITDFWFINKQVEWNGYNPSSALLDCLEEFIIRKAKKPKSDEWDRLISSLEDRYFNTLWMRGHPKRMINFLTNSFFFKAQKSSIAKKIILLNYFEKHQKYHNILNESYDNNSDTNLSKLDFLKLRVFSNGKSSHSNLVKISFCQTEKFFLQSIPQNLREQYLNDVSPCYSKYKVKLSYVDVKYCEFQKSKLLGCIIHKIKSKHPYSLIRLSDGEGYFFTNDFSKISFNESDARNRERHWWGFEQSTMIREAVIRGGIDSIKNADILGIPTIYRFLRDISNNSKSFYDNTQARGVMSVLIGIKNFNLNSIEFTDSFVNRSVFSSVEVLQQLAAISTKVVIVSGAKYNAIKNLFENKCDFKIIEIPTHAKQVGNAKYCVDDFPLPYFVEDIKAKVHAETSPGTLVLVGAGIAGKCFINAAKESGGVGLDLGSVFDSLSQAGFEALF